MCDDRVYCESAGYVIFYLGGLELFDLDKWLSCVQLWLFVFVVADVKLIGKWVIVMCFDGCK